MSSTWICISDIFHILVNVKTANLTAKSSSWLICRSYSFLDHWPPCSEPSMYSPQPYLDASLWKRTCACGCITNLPSFWQWQSALPKWGKTVFVLEIEFVTFVRSKTVDGLGALLEWLKKEFLLVLSDPEVISLMLYINSGIDPLFSLFFPLVMT